MDTSTYDIIFAGGVSQPLSCVIWYRLKDFLAGGAAACVTAGRLAAADPSLKILVRNCSLQTCEGIPSLLRFRY